MYTKYDRIIGTFRIRKASYSPTSHRVYLRSKALDDGSHFELATHSQASIYTVRWWGEDQGYTIEDSAVPSDTRRVICTSRTDYTSDAQYKTGELPLWLYVWMHGGNQFWSFEPASGSLDPDFLIRNTFSGYFMCKEKDSHDPVIYQSPSAHPHRATWYLEKA